ncbi:MAG: FxsA family protein [Alphaproteobacteria bacterium]|nr:FxsA family protein [Alphaproteobacteria bacterium]
MVFLKLFLAFTLIPAVELYLLIRLGEWMGALYTVLLILTTGALGAALAKREGFSVLRQIQQEAQAGFPSGDRLVEGFLVVVAGLLLITPGVMTDLTGFLLIAPPSRRFIAPRLKQALLARVKVMGVNAGPMRPGPGWSPPDDGPQGELNEEPSPRRSGGSPFDHPSF